MIYTTEEWRAHSALKWVWFQNHIKREARRYDQNSLAIAMEHDLRLVYPLQDFEIRKAKTK